MTEEKNYEETRDGREMTPADSTWEPVIAEEAEFSEKSSELLKQFEDFETSTEGNETGVATSMDNDSHVDEQTEELHYSSSEIDSPLKPQDSATSDPSQTCRKTEEIEDEVPTETVDPTGSQSTSASTPDEQALPAAPASDVIRIIDEKLGSIVNAEQRLFTEVREMHKLYHSEFAGRLLSMQNELDQYRKVEKGRVYDDILAAIARIYGNNETLVDEVVEPKVKKSIRYLLMDLEELMESYGMSKLRSNQGDKRNPRHCQIHNRIPTDNPQQHDTVVKSYNSGFYIGNRTVIKEMVDIFVFEGTKASDSKEDTQVNETVESTVTE